MNLAEFMALSLKSSGFTDDIDLIIPVPLHPSKKRIRGFNQSDCISTGIADVTGIPVDTGSLARTTGISYTNKTIEVRKMDKC